MKQEILQLINLWFLKLKVKLAMKMADYKHYITNKRYYVIPFTDGGIMVVNNEDIKLKKKEGLINKRCNHIDISAKALYWTAVYRNDSLDISDRVHMYRNYRNWVKIAAKLKIGNPSTKDKKLFGNQFKK